MATTETSKEFTLEHGSQTPRPIRPKLLKLTDVQMPSTRIRKKSKFKVNYKEILHMYLEIYIHIRRR